MLRVLLIYSHSPLGTQCPRELCIYTNQSKPFAAVLQLGTGLLCLFSYLLYYAAVLIHLPIMLKAMLKNKNCA